MAWSILGDEPLLPERQWQPPPFRRGTNQILVECFATLLLCVWTAVHLNLQPQWKHDEKGFRKLTSKIPWKKCGYLVLGMIAPELVTVVAIYQWRMTNQLWAEIQKTELVGPTLLKERRLKRLWKWIASIRKPTPGRDEEIEIASGERPMHSKSATVISVQALHDSTADSLAQADSPSSRHEDGEDERTSSISSSNQQNGTSAIPDGPTEQQHITKEQPGRRRHYWTKTHCWYAYIGGFVIQDLHGESFPLPNGLKRMSLNTEAILHFAKTHPQAFPDISEPSIRDKSKANALAKFIVCGQALWFCANLVGRVIARLPITALELNTSAHCICTILTYILWWRKPYNVSDATALILDDETASEAAYLCLNSWDGQNIVCEGSDLRYLPRYLSWIGSVVGFQYLKLRETDLAGTTCNTLHVADDCSPQERSHGLVVDDLQSFPAIFRGSIRWWFRSPFPFISWMIDGSADHEGKMRVPYAGETRRLVTLAMKYVKRHDRCIRNTDPEDCPRAWRSTPDFSWGFFFGVDDSHLVWDHAVQGIMLLACTLYGGVHLLAFNGPFPSMIHRVGWYSGAFAFVPFIFWLMFATVYFETAEFIRPSVSKQKMRYVDAWLGLAIVFFGLVSQVMFFLFRGFLTYEPYAALGFAPAGAYEVPNWSAYFIHIS
ncbi:hypothetical protein CC79DRAFT_674151 [Sarocladium strictum]